MAQIASVMEAAEAMDMRPKDEREFRAFVANVNATIGQISSIKTDSTGLVDQAGKCGMIEEMKELNKSLSQLKALEDKLRVAEQKIKCEFGSFGDSVREYVGKPPTFCGDAGKGLEKIVGGRRCLAVPWTDGLADITAKEMFADQGPKMSWNRPLEFDGQV